MSKGILETCLQRVPNRFELVFLAFVRARKIAAKEGVGRGGPPGALGGRLSRKGRACYQKPPVLALKEIASGVSYLEDIRSESRSSDAAGLNAEGTKACSEDSGA